MEELVKRLRTATTLPVMNSLCQEAADAIEELGAIREEQKAQIIIMAAEIEELKTYAELYQSLTDKSQKMARNLLDAYPKWISVTERLPREMETVIVTDGKNVGYSFCVNDYGTLDFYSPWNITHWMPLPQPPKEGGNGQTN